ncbi:hypothetical protein Slin15195_G003270 [Septoria linicola]|uniref:Uncharacterized protein n=1 Tax=Septoria linicola TaxID=215465 RepID=A0A9Q9AIW5_9PEZI|nr:hypothetical protein Slin14017_G003300 [Septoria linicola]USW47008.1 hypothetical protein Slin15195_G003270 [Septoria linicola]
MSAERSSSAVRNLRSLFENKASEHLPPDGRGRSPGELTVAANNNDLTPRPRSKIRASFIAVESPPTTHHPFTPRAMTMASAPDFSKIPNSDAKDTLDQMSALNREPSTGRRTSFSQNADSHAVQAIKATVAEEGERRKSHAVAEVIPEAAVETPLVEADKQLGGQKGGKGSPLKREFSPKKKEESKAAPLKVDKEAENPDKHLTGAEEEPAIMKPAAPTNSDAVSGGQALSHTAEDLRKTTAKPASKAPSTKPATKPAAISTANKTSRPSVGLKSPQSTTSSTRTATSPKPITKKPSRASLAAPTAASVARAAGADKAATKPAAAKPKPREPTKPVEVSSRLTAPTAASRARVEGPTAPAAKSASAATTRPKPAGSARPSLGRPESRGSQNPTKKTSAPVDGSFLERMTRPTAASANRIAKEAEAKAAARKQKLPSRPKTNGHPKKARPSTIDSAEHGDETIVDEPSVLLEGDHVGDSTEQAKVIAADNRPGSPTGDHAAVPATNGAQDGALEGTPAALGSGDAIR